jgi:crotonobetainyl-CoA:carnitine CoA-transferase CaiB-like acyl-CoA transferase
VSGPLHGVKVLDLTRILAGPYATMMLADAGAEVLKVERPGTGDDTRGYGPPFVDTPGGSGGTSGPHDKPAGRESVYFLAINRGKRSITLDFKDEGDLARLHDLIRGADVLCENFRPGVMEKLGLSEERLAELNPALVVLSITGFGEGGPEGHRSGFDQIVQGEAGLMSITGPLEGPPSKVGVPISDILAGMFGAYGVVAALVERARTGQGQWVRTSLLAGSVAVHTYQGTRWLVAGDVPGLGSNRHPTIQPYGAFDCADGTLNICVGSEGLWRRFAPLVGIDPDDPRFATNGDRVERVDELEAAMAPALRSASVDEWVRRLGEAGVPAGKVKTMDEVYASPQVDHLGLVETVKHATLGDIRLPGCPIDYSRTRRDVSLPPPTLGQHDGEGFTDPPQDRRAR